MLAGASPYVKYLGVFIDENLNWKMHINEISTKLIKGNAMLSKLRHYVNKDILLSVYYGIFHSHLAYTCPLFHRSEVLKFVDLVSLENCIFVNKCFNNKAFSLFSNNFKLTPSSHSYCTRSVRNGLIFKRLYNTIRYGNKSIINSAVSTWNHFQTIFHGHNLLNMSPKKMKSLISKYFLRTMKIAFAFLNYI